MIKITYEYTSKTAKVDNMISFLNIYRRENMCRKSCIDFVLDHLTKEELEGKRIIEIGSRYINGSIRSYIMNIGKPDTYVGIDLSEGNHVDVKMDYCCIKILI